VAKSKNKIAVVRLVIHLVFSNYKVGIRDFSNRPFIRIRCCEIDYNFKQSRVVLLARLKLCGI
jgi:hypothetical protein